MNLRRFGMRYENEILSYDEPEFDITPTLSCHFTWEIRFDPTTNLELLQDDTFWHWSAYEVELS